MIQKLIMFTIVLFIVGAPYASAHSALLSSTPADGAEVNSQITTIKMKFNTKIEDVLQITVKNEEGRTFKLSETSITDDTVVGTFENPLKNGTYTLTPKVIGSDGHAIEAKFSFQVNVLMEQNESPASKEQVDQNGTSSNSSQKGAQSDSNDQSETPTKTENEEVQSSTETKGEEVSDNSRLSFGIIAIIAVITLILVISAIGLLKINTGKK